MSTLLAASVGEMSVLELIQRWCRESLILDVEDTNAAAQHELNALQNAFDET